MIPHLKIVKLSWVSITYCCTAALGSLHTGQWAVLDVTIQELTPTPTERFTLQASLELTSPRSSDGRHEDSRRKQKGGALHFGAVEDVLARHHLPMPLLISELGRKRLHTTFDHLTACRQIIHMDAKRFSLVGCIYLNQRHPVYCNNFCHD